MQNGTAFLLGAGATIGLAAVAATSMISVYGEKNPNPLAAGAAYVGFGGILALPAAAIGLVAYGLIAGSSPALYAAAGIGTVVGGAYLLNPPQRQLPRSAASG